MTDDYSWEEPYECICHKDGKVGLLCSNCGKAIYLAQIQNNGTGLYEHCGTMATRCIEDGWNTKPKRLARPKLWPPEDTPK